MKALVFLWVGLSLAVSPCLGQIPALERGSIEAFQFEAEDRARSAAERMSWENAQKISYYEHDLPSEVVMRIDEDRPQDVQPGQEAWLIRRRAQVASILGKTSCVLVFDSDDVFILKNHPTQALFQGKYVVLASPVRCSRDVDGTRILEFVPREELKKRCGEKEWDAGQLHALEYAGFREWELRDGEKFFGRFVSVSQGELHLLGVDGQSQTLEPKELSAAGAKFYREEWKKAQTLERQERAKAAKKKKQASKPKRTPYNVF